MSLDTLSDLRSSVADHLDRDDLTDQIDDFIRLAESRHRRDIRIREMIETESLVVDDRTIDLPDGFLQGVNLRLMTQPGMVLSEVSIHELNRNWRDTPGQPRMYAIQRQVEFEREPDQNYDAELTFYKAVTPLSDGNPSNPILEIAPDCYLYASLMASAPFLLNDERVQLWGTLYSEARDALNQVSRISRRIGPLVSRVGSVP